MSNSKRLKIISVFLFILLCVILWIVYASYRQSSSSFVSGKNATAQQAYNNINLGYQEYFESNNLPVDGTYYLFGECSQNLCYTVYANEIIKNNSVIYGNESDGSIDSYWAIKIENSKLQEAWISSHPLNEEFLKPYTEAEQLEQVSIWDYLKAQNSVIGYYSITNIN